MENKECLNEEQYQKSNIKVKKIGKILLVIGIVILIVGILFMILGGTGIGNTIANTKNTASNNIGGMQQTSSIFGNFGLFALGGFMDTIGFGLIVAGGIAISVSHRREITAYAVQQTMPIAKEGIEKITPTIGDAAGTIAQSVTKGIKEGLKNEKSK